MLLSNTKFEIGEVIYLKTDKEQLPRIIFGIDIRQHSLTYRVAQGITCSEHFDFELTREKDTVLAVE